MSQILVIQTGGTIDKDYLATGANHGYNFNIGESAWHSIWQRAQAPYEVRFSTVCQKDSLELTEEDRRKVLRQIGFSRENKVVILHGTDTIVETAKYLSDILHKTVVITGAMKPAKFRESDADFNVGMAVAAVNLLPPGVYIALNGDVVPWDAYTPR